MSLSLFLRASKIILISLLSVPGPMGYLSLLFSKDIYNKSSKDDTVLRAEFGPN